VRLAHDCGLSNSAECQVAAGLYADIAALTTARELGAPWLADISYGAAFAGSVLKLEWLYTQQHCQLPAEISKHAAQGGSFEVLVWLKQHGISFSQETCTTAAEYDNLIALQFLHSEGCALDTGLCNVAAQNGSTDVLKWLMQQGLACTEEACILCC
jgi:hypothetical protein